MITLKIKGARYRASTVREILDNVAQDNGYQSYKHFLNSKKGA